MSSIEVAARFAAYTWFQNQPQNRGRGVARALAYADRHHGRYIELALANRGVGRLLADVIAERMRARRKTFDSRSVISSALCGSV